MSSSASKEATTVPYSLRRVEPNRWKPTVKQKVGHSRANKKFFVFISFHPVEIIPRIQNMKGRIDLLLRWQEILVGKADPQKCDFCASDRLVGFPAFNNVGLLLHLLKVGIDDILIWTFRFSLGSCVFRWGGLLLLRGFSIHCFCQLVGSCIKSLARILDLVYIISL